jgi:anti-sigma-K factor RskA
MLSSVEAFEPTEGYGATTQAGAVARNWRGTAVLKLAVLSLAVVAVLAISGVFTSSNQVPTLCISRRTKGSRSLLLSVSRGNTNNFERVDD